MPCFEAVKIQAAKLTRPKIPKGSKGFCFGSFFERPSRLPGGLLRRRHTRQNFHRKYLKCIFSFQIVKIQGFQIQNPFFKNLFQLTKHHFQRCETEVYRSVISCQEALRKSAGLTDDMSISCFLHPWLQGILLAEAKCFHWLKRTEKARCRKDDIGFGLLESCSDISRLDLFSRDRGARY